jgi:aspartate--ammonia ligase
MKPPATRGAFFIYQSINFIMKQHELLQTEQAIHFVKDHFAQQLCQKLHLSKVSSPMVVLDGTGINDDLNGVERPAAFPIKSMQERRGLVVHSLAKWKRLRLKQLAIQQGHGILTDMRALRPDEDYSSIHSIYVDQWDWEKHIAKTDRTLAYLKSTVKAIYEALKATERAVEAEYPDLKASLPDHITFVHAETLLQQYPGLSVKARETEAAKKYGAIFIIGIGAKLSDGAAHDGRAPDYDDWSSQNEEGFLGLNGDIVVWHPVLQSAFELSSMGIRVDEQAMEKQLAERGCPERATLQFHQMLLSGQLPQSIGGGIGQSRVCMFMLKKAHIGQVQVSIWPEAEVAQLEAAEVYLL